MVVNGYWTRCEVNCVGLMYRQVGDRPGRADAAGGTRLRSVWCGAERQVAWLYRHSSQDDEGRYHVRGRLHRGSQSHDVSQISPETNLYVYFLWNNLLLGFSCEAGNDYTVRIHFRIPNRVSLWVGIKVACRNKKRLMEKT